MSEAKFTKGRVMTTKAIGTTGLTRQELNVLVAEKEGFSTIELSETDSALIISEGLWRIADYCKKPSDAWPIIEKIWDELMLDVTPASMPKWWYTQKKHNCTKLEAAMLIYVERD